MVTLICPHCQHTVGTLNADAGDHQVLVRAASTARIEANRRAGLARAASVSQKFARNADGTFISNAEVEMRAQRYNDWLYAVPGRAGGVARPDTAHRDDFGCFARRMP